MTVLRFAGVVQLGDEYRVESEHVHGAVRVGGADVVASVDGVKWDGPVTFAMADDRWTGDVAVELGWGYSEYTPMDADKLWVGEHDIIARLVEHEGKQVTVWFADEPVNLLDES